jgi:hypothetical protein
MTVLSAGIVPSMMSWSVPRSSWNVTESTAGVTVPSYVKVRVTVEKDPSLEQLRLAGTRL